MENAESRSTHVHLLIKRESGDVSVSLAISYLSTCPSHDRTKIIMGSGSCAYKPDVRMVSVFWHRFDRHGVAGCIRRSNSAIAHQCTGHDRSDPQFACADVYDVATKSIKSGFLAKTQT